MERQMEEVSGGEQATIAGVISDLREKGYTIKEIVSGTNNVIGVKLNKSEISMGKNSTEEIIYEYEYASGTTIRYFVEVQGKNYEILFNNGEIIVSTIETDLADIDKLPEVTVTSSNNEIVEAQKTGERKIEITSKEKGGEITITVTCAGKPVTCIVTVELFVGINKNETDPEGALPSGGIEIIESDASKGIVIKDKNNREWVWIEVPKTEVFKTATSSTDYTNIKNDLITYAGVYRKGSASQNENWSDTWYSGCGIDTPEKYTEMYNKMINSVYNNGGFWIQRYEDGRNNITVTTAQEYASQLGPDSVKTSSLLFGIQWDLVCKYLEVNVEWPTPPSGKTNQYYLNEDSRSWGRYSGSPSSKLPENERKNIYDFAGNFQEFTLEHATSDSRFQIVLRGSTCINPQTTYQASVRLDCGTAYKGWRSCSFRATFY